MKPRTLDLTGEVCPVPLMRTQETMDQLPPGAELVIETDYARSVRNISQWCWRQGLGCEIRERRDGTWQVTVRKTIP